jgi:hypothetical protein
MAHNEGNKPPQTLTTMTQNLPAQTAENELLTKALEQLNLEFLERFTQNKEMVEDESPILTSLYLEKLGQRQLELLQKQTEAARLKLKMNLVHAAINRNEKPDLKEIERILDEKLQAYYLQIVAQSTALDQAQMVLSNLIPPEVAQKLKETFRVLCKRLHPDLHPNQTEEEKDLFIKVKAAYDLQRLEDLQQILLYLDDTAIEKLALVSGEEKKERMAHLKSSIIALRDKIGQLLQSFPFTVKALIFDGEKIALKQAELQGQIQIFEEEIAYYTNIIALMTDE